MGKIRIKTFEESTPEEDAKQKAKKEAKKAAKKAVETPVETAETPEETIKTTQPKVQTSQEIVETPKETVKTEAEKKPAKKAKKEKFVKVKETGKRHKENLGVVSKTQTYNINQALEVLKKFKKSKFNETVELHINTKEKGVSGQVTLPHGTGKTLRIKLADDETIAQVAKGKIDFDVLVATPQMMPQLARVAKVLGPRGLMPNPKNGTISDKPEEAIKKLSAGQINYKTEAAAPIIHVSVGKISFDDSKLKENMKTLLESVGAANISNVTLKSTMSPAIKLEYTTHTK